ncbi:MAG: hypothetical protein JXX29_19470 [Deltaproteobacteria bacterium]|nr:hypothetical protein [Deltaproteobacteria bacterium]MBN2673869.1 hypothetical protein [Deltaproteobacteria bacterium]
MQKNFILHLFLWLLLGLAGCGSSNPVIQVDGIDIYQDEWTKTTHEISAKLRFELDCEGPYEFVLIKKQFRYPSEVGVVGCERKWIFSRSVDVMVAGPWNYKQTAVIGNSRFTEGDDGEADADDMAEETAESNVVSTDDEAAENSETEDSEATAQSGENAASTATSGDTDTGISAEK